MSPQTVSLWKRIVSAASGLAAVGIVVWALAKSFFVTRVEYDLQRAELIRISEQLAQIKHSVESQSSDLREINTTLSDIRVKLARVDNEVKRVQ
jgi:tRNA1(Val) A37 N6-methylase TrmN6